jgi:very-short-patch-repair endonuclease
MGRQHGVATRAQFLAAGIPAPTISTWLRRGRLQRVLPQVYLAGPPQSYAHVQAALLWLPEGVASHRTAAWILGLLDRRPEVVEVTVPRHCTRQATVPWLRLYRRDLPLAVQLMCGELAVVEPEQALLDCMAVLDGDAAARLFGRALVGLVRQQHLRQRHRDNLGRHGNTAAWRQLREAVPGAASHPERVLAKALQRAGLHGFRVNHPVRGFLADLLDRDLRLIIEVDGWSTHSDRAAFQRDRTRQNVLVAAGYTVLRYTADDVTRRLPAVVAEVAMVVTKLRQARAV